MPQKGEVICARVDEGMLSAGHLSRAASRHVVRPSCILSNCFHACLLSPHLGRVYCAGSSLMPQKKNLDALELIRGKAGRLQGNLSGLLAVMKSAPTTYNKDFQEAWELMFDSVDTAFDCIRISTGVISTIKINPDRMLAGLSDDMLATDLAEYIVRKGELLSTV